MELMIWLYLLELRRPPRSLNSNVSAGPLASEFPLRSFFPFLEKYYPFTARKLYFSCLLPIESQKSDSISLPCCISVPSKLSVFLLKWLTRSQVSCLIFSRLSSYKYPWCFLQNMLSHFLQIAWQFPKSSSFDSFLLNSSLNLSPSSHILL